MRGWRARSGGVSYRALRRVVLLFLPHGVLRRVRARSLLDLAYAERDMRAGESGNCERRKRVKRLLQLCPGDWRARRIVHWCRRGCCSSHQDAIQKVTAAVLEVFHVPGVPAANKWLSVAMAFDGRPGHVGRHPPSVCARHEGSLR